MNYLNELTILESKQDVSFTEINQLTESVGWGKNFYSTQDHWEKALDDSSYIAYIKKEGNVIAFGRILEDGQMCMFYDICVHPNYQKQSLGSRIMKHLINKVKDKNYVSIGLFVWPGNPTAAEFYNKFGFELSSAMELKKYMKKV